jgi:probable addiction module antidote protein
MWVDWMPISKDKSDLKARFGNNPKAIARYLNESLAKDQLQPVLTAFDEILRAQNVQSLAREAGMRRDKLYGTFGGKVDPTLGRVLKLLRALNVRLVAVAWDPRSIPPRPKLGRPKKQKMPEARE